MKRKFSINNLSLIFSTIFIFLAAMVFLPIAYAAKGPMTGIYVGSKLARFVPKFRATPSYNTNSRYTPRYQKPYFNYHSNYRAPYSSYNNHSTNRYNHYNNNYQRNYSANSYQRNYSANSYQRNYSTNSYQRYSQPSQTRGYVFTNQKAWLNQRYHQHQQRFHAGGSNRYSHSNVRQSENYYSGY